MSVTNSSGKGWALGTATETETQHRKATGKGGLDFALGFQEQLQRPDVLPETLHYEFEQRDEEGELLEIEVKTAQARLVRRGRPRVSRASRERAATCCDG